MTRPDIDHILDEYTGPIAIVSGEGGPGTPELYDGVRSGAAIRRRLRREESGGDRWAYAVVYSHDADAGPVGVDLTSGAWAAWPSSLDID